MYQQTNVLMFIMGSCYLFLALVSYYSMSFLMASSLLFWNFETPISSSCVGIRWLVKYHLGSVVLCSLARPGSAVMEFIVNIA